MDEQATCGAGVGMALLGNGIPVCGSRQTRDFHCAFRVETNLQKSHYDDDRGVGQIPELVSNEMHYPGSPFVETNAVFTPQLTRMSGPMRNVLFIGEIKVKLRKSHNLDCFQHSIKLPDKVKFI